MDVGDPDAPTHKRPRLDSVNPVYNGLPPPQPPSAQSNRHPSHPTSAQASSPPPPRAYPPHGLPHPSHTYPPPVPGPYGPPQPSPSLPPSDIRHLPAPRNSISSPGHRPHGLPGTPVTLPARHISQDTISSYRTPTPQSSAAQDQGSRSNSVNITIDPNRTDPTAPQGMEHGVPSPWPTNPDPHAVRHGSIPNGYNSTMSPPNESQFHTPPLPQTPHYGQPAPMAPYSNGPYMAQYGAGAAQMRRKQVRATQACNHCRSRKQKCDEARPCSFCRDNNFDCQYKDVPPPKQDRSMMQLQDSVNNIADTLKSFVENFNVWKQHVDGKLAQSKLNATASPAFDHASPQQGFGVRNLTNEQYTTRLPTPVQGRTQYNRVNSMKMESPVVTHSHISPVPAHSSTPVKRESYQVNSGQPATPADSVVTSYTQVAPDPAIDNERIGLKADHRTPAHRLFIEWTSMAKFCEGIPYMKQLEEEGHRKDQYPMLMEQDRGLLRVWGVGEGHDLYDGAHGPGSPENHLDSDSPSPSSTKEGLWGCPPVDHASPNILVGDLPQREHVGGLGQDGKPDFRAKTLWTLYQSYLDNMHNLHPFLNPAKLRKMIQEFQEVYSPDHRKSHMSPSAVPERLNGGIKRKRSSSMYGDAYGLADDLARGSIERSLRNAIILLVLALGKVCKHTEKLPSPQSDRIPTTNGTWGYYRDSPRSTNDSFSSDFSDTRARNIDILPGMAYFSYATDILGNQSGGNTVAHAQAMLLAALYLGQFGRVLESWSWTNNACRICLVLIRREGKKIYRKKITQNAAGQNVVEEPDNSPAEERHRLNLIKCVYWTCLQMESDIIAEISELQPSAITTYQTKIEYPSGVYESFGEAMPEMHETSEHTKNLFIYSSQIHLRVILNDAHNSLYGARLGFDNNNIDEIGEMARSHAELLAAWRRLLPEPLAWDDSDPPSTDINIARMRAKYYGGYYVVLRPLLFKAIHHMKLPPTVSSDSNSPLPAVDTSFASTNLHRDIVDLSTEDMKALEIVQSCVESAIQSTIAFDRIGADENAPYRNFESQRKFRLIVPNIFGTLHAQFGNMLVLTAVYNSQMRKFLPNKNCLTKDILSALFTRTQEILWDMAGNSPVLSLDYDILDNIAKQHSIPYRRPNRAG